MSKSSLKRALKDAAKAKVREERNERMRQGDWYTSGRTPPGVMSPLQEIVYMALGTEEVVEGDREE